MANYRSYKHTLEQVDSLVDYYNEVLRKNLKTYFVGIKKIVKNIDNGKGIPAKEVYIRVDLDKTPASRGPIHEAFSQVEKMLKKEHKIRATYYIGGCDK